MSKDEIMKLATDSYKQGYYEGFQDACNTMRDATLGLCNSVKEALEKHNAEKKS